MKRVWTAMSGRTLRHGKATRSGEMRLSGRRAAAIACAVVAAQLILELTPVLDAFDTNVERRIDFQVRQRLGYGPSLHPSLKLLALDDQTTAILKGWNALSAVDLPLTTWARLFEALAVTKPRLIFIDKIFETPSGRDDAPAFVRRVKALDVPLIGAAYTSETANTSRDESRSDRPEFLGYSGIARGPANKAPVHLYGPWTGIEAAFAKIGHIMMLDGNRVRRAYPLAGGAAIPHWSLFLEGPKGLPPTDAEGAMLLNLVDRRTLLPRVRSLGWALQRIAEGLDLTGFAPGDVIIIVPSFFTGNVDFKDTALGRMEGGLLQASAANAVLTGKHLRPIGSRAGLGATLALIGAGAAAVLTPIVFWPFFVTALAGVVGGSIFAFMGFGLVLPWLTPAIAFAAGGIATSVARQRADFLRKRLLESELELGRAVQTLLLPKARRGALGGYDFSIVFEPFGAMSGDWMQIFQADAAEGGRPARGVFAIGDVVGKGPSAALATAAIASIWTRYTETWTHGVIDIDAFMRDVNDTMRLTFKTEQSTTISVAVVEGDEITLASCGAPRWIRVRPGGLADRIKTPPDNPLGVREHSSPYAIARVTLDPGDFLIAHTDGVMDGGEAFMRFRDRIATLSFQSTAAAFLQLEQAAKTAGEDLVLPDDITILVLRRDAAQQRSAPEVA